MRNPLLILAVLATLLTSGLLVRSGRPRVCINSKLVHNISIVGSSQVLENCSQAGQGVLGGAELSFWEAKKIAQKLEKINLLPVASQVQTLRLFVHLDGDSQFKNWGSLWEIPLKDLQGGANLSRSLIDHWAQSRYQGMSAFHRSVYTELVLKLILKEKSDFAGYINSWATGPYQFSEYCRFNQLSFRMKSFCLNYFKSEASKEKLTPLLADQAWGLQYFVAQIFADYYEGLSGAEKKEFTSQLLSLRSSESVDSKEIVRSKSFVQRKKTVRAYFSTIFSQITGSDLPPAFIKLMDQHGLSDRVLSVSIE